MGQWSGKAETLESIYLTELKLDDYVLATYASASRKPVNFYVSYYAAQIKGNAAHSPRACIPGDGWEILSMTRVRVPESTANWLPLYANRALIRKGGQKALVYYWFQARGRVVTNEYLVKLYNLWDAIVSNRSDGALVRLVTVIDPGESEEAADARVAEFAQSAVPVLDDYIPL